MNKNQKKIYWPWLSSNKGAIQLLEQNPNKIYWDWLSKNPAIFEIDYAKLKERIEPFEEELIQKCMHPNRLEKYLEEYNYDIGEDAYI